MWKGTRLFLADFLTAIRGTFIHSIVQISLDNYHLSYKLILIKTRQQHFNYSRNGAFNHELRPQRMSMLN